MSNQEIHSMVIKVLTMFFSLSEWLKLGNSTHMMAWPLSLVGCSLWLQSLGWWNKRVLLSDQEMDSTIVNVLNRAKRVRCHQKLQQKWRQKNARVLDTKLEDYLLAHVCKQCAKKWNAKFEPFFLLIRMWKDLHQNAESCSKRMLV